MVDDDLDLDLDLDSEPERPKRRGLRGRREAADKTPVPPPQTPASNAGKAATEGAAKTPVVPAEQQGLVGRILAPVSRALGRLRLPEANAKSFLLGLLVLVLLVLAVENWPPMRLNFIGWHVDIPKTIVLAVGFALGYLVARSVCRRDQPTNA